MIRSSSTPARRLGPVHQRVGTALYRVGRTEHALGRLAEAEPTFAEAIRVFDAALGPDGQRAARVRAELGRLQLDAGRPGKALELLEPARARLEPELSPDRLSSPARE